MLVVWVSTSKSQPQAAPNSTSAAEIALDSTSLLGYSIVQVCTMTMHFNPKSSPFHADILWGQQTYPHDPNAFTQGLEYDKVCNGTSCQDIFWESTGTLALSVRCHCHFSCSRQCDQSDLLCPGLYGMSTVRQVDMLTGNVVRQQALSARDFGEGITKFGSR